MGGIIGKKKKEKKKQSTRESYIEVGIPEELFCELLKPFKY